MSRRNPAILTYHSIDNTGSVISTSPRQFHNQMRVLSQSGIPVLPLTQVAGVPGAVAVTFDDGFENFLEHALPVLEEFRVPATVFVVSGYCGKQNDWPTQPAGIPRMKLMDWGTLREIAGRGVSLGAHTVSHPKLPDLAAGECARELRDSRTEIENRIGQAVCSFAYPYGACNPAVRHETAQHFAVACTTMLGYVPPRPDPIALPRLDTFYLQDQSWFRNLHSPKVRSYIALRGVARALKSHAIGER